MAVARVGAVVGIVAGQPDEQPRVGRLELDRAAERPIVLVVIVDAKIEIAPEPVMAEPRAGDAAEGAFGFDIYAADAAWL